MPADRSQPHKALHIPRPMNSFFVFRRSGDHEEIAKQVVREQDMELEQILEATQMTYADYKSLKQTRGSSAARVSKMLGSMWKALSAEQQQPYKDKAEMLRVQHKVLYPDYRFRPRKHAKSLLKATAEEATSSFLPPAPSPADIAPVTYETSSSHAPIQQSAPSDPKLPLTKVSDHYTFVFILLIRYRSRRLLLPLNHQVFKTWLSPKGFTPSTPRPCRAFLRHHQLGQGRHYRSLAPNLLCVDNFHYDSRRFFDP